MHDFAGAEIVDGYDGQQFDHPFYDLNFASSFARDPLFGGHDETLENNAAQTAPPHLPAAQPVHIWNTHGTHVQVGPGHHPVSKTSIFP